MDLNLKGKRALVCGSTQGIGMAAAMELANLGASITLLARNQEALEEVKDELFAGAGQNHEILIADFAKPENLRKVLADHINIENPYHILINNTGGPPGGLAIDAEIEAFRIAFNQHLVCNHILAQAVVEGMKKDGFGRIINVISTSVKIPINGLGVSNTIRGAVGNWSKTLANELGAYNITVNNILPGATNTGRLKEIIKNKAQKLNLQESEIEKQMADQVPLMRIAEPIEVANAVVFLASDKARYISGVNLPVDGGRTKSL